MGASPGNPSGCGDHCPRCLFEAGVNIVWTPDMSSSGNRALAHGSGKTTFCRLLRACLGEPDYATEAQRNRIMTRLPNGMIAAEIMVDGACWVSVIPLGLQGEKFTVQTESVEAAIARGRLEEDVVTIDGLLADTFLSNVLGNTPPEVSAEQVWDVLRAWMSRDQECRLDDILHWRSRKTHTRSRAQELGETAKLTMVRLALRALDAEEQQAAAQARELEAFVEEERRKQAYRQQSHEDGVRAVRKGLGADDDIGFEDSLEQKGLISLAEEALAKSMRAELPKSQDVGTIFARLNALNEQREGLLKNQQSYEREIELKKGEAERLRSEANLGEIDLTQGKIMVCPVLRVDVDGLQDRGCNVSLEPSELDTIKGKIEEKTNTAAQLEGEVSSAEQEVRRLTAQIAQLQDQHQALEKEAKEVDAANSAAQRTAKEITDKVYQARRILDDARALRDEEASIGPGPSKTAEIEAVRAQLEQGRKRARSAIRTLEEQYQGIMAAWLPDGVEGSIKLDGNGLKVDAQFSGRGEVSTAALDSLKIVAFDLAALHMAVEEKADLPAFLIHDSPREADLDGQLYARLFSLVRQWEGESGTPCFQYIVTTTTAPPEDMQNEDYVRLEMTSTPAEKRLFRRDL